ncbi:hypothetical protein H9X85_07325 [Anaerotignum lactatifermentans]|uniref:Uncharacterized protein n=1 Tax=Anaerotignum lactatifermentans TaxID=160404 RepID=A0ABS2G9T0_9FIRM|nr:hypothetical protein [Anaerotignum lactatifermentans]MBM6829442.1 hypothetical protein [Anaerotignum lactatifermentans]MBM6877800.1 hypothetical protein [Anaerotignum lactatifermentans]MBM6951019.1 hypothetical protein [Anaerotignum lactatifermentans]
MDIHFLFFLVSGQYFLSTNNRQTKRTRPRPRLFAPTAPKGGMVKTLAQQRLRPHPLSEKMPSNPFFPKHTKKPQEKLSCGFADFFRNAVSS